MGLDKFGKGEWLTLPAVIFSGQAARKRNTWAACAGGLGEGDLQKTKQGRRDLQAFKCKSTPPMPLAIE